MGISSAGTYYRQVYIFTYYHNDGEYGLTVSRYTKGPMLKRSNNTFSTADSVSSGTQIKGQLSLIYQCGCLLYSSVWLWSSSLNLMPYYPYTGPLVVLYDSGGKIIADQSTGKDTSFSRYIFSRTYYAAVYTPSYYHNDGRYELSCRNFKKLKMTIKKIYCRTKFSDVF